MPVKNKGRKPRNPKTKPFFPHASGYWAAKINGKLEYLARWSTPTGEVQRIYDQRLAESQAAGESNGENDGDGEAASVEAGEPTVRDIANLFLREKADEAEMGELSWTTWAGYKRHLAWFIQQIGDRPADTLGPDDFGSLNKELKRECGYHHHQSRVTTFRMALSTAAENEWISPPRYGTQFRGPKLKRHRHERAQKNEKLFSPGEIRSLVETATPYYRAIVLLGINCAYIASDLAALPVKFDDRTHNEVQLDAELPYIRFDRPKTGERRKCTLWPETVKALKQVIGRRRTGLIFTTRRGKPLVHNHQVRDGEKNVTKATNCDALGKPFRELCQEAGCYVKGRGYSALRSTFETRAMQMPELAVADQAAIHWIMGHRLSGPDTPRQADTYFQDIDPGTLKHVTDAVREWYLYADSEK
jgi:integrase